MSVSCDSFGYSADDCWHQLPPRWKWREATAVACDSKDRVYVFNRGAHPLIVFDRQGEFQDAWGEGLFIRPHGIFIGPDDSVWLTDDGDHTVRKFTTGGKLLLTLGSSGKPSDTGATTTDYRTIQRAGPPFNFPTNVALSPDGDIYVSDGYGNARIHKFSADGKLLYSWGEPGAGPGQFHVPHGVVVDKQGTVYVADRENNRIQLFAPDGKFLSEWTDLARPSRVFIDRDGNFYVTELGYRAGMWPGTTAPTPDATGGRFSIFNAKRELIARWGGGDDPTATGDFFAPHDVWVDSHGDIYVAEVTWSAGGKNGAVPADCHSLQKFTRMPLAA